MKRLKALASMILTLALGVSLAACGQTSQNTSSAQNANAASTTQEAPRTVTNSIVFINSSQSADGNTAKMGQQMLNGLDYGQVNIMDYAINFLGQNRDGDQFDQFLENIKNAKTIVIGSPVYWHSVSGALKTVIDRSSQLTGDNPFQRKKLYFFLQGAAPTQLAQDSSVYMIQRFAAQMGMDLKGTATTSQQVATLTQQIQQDEK